MNRIVYNSGIIIRDPFYLSTLCVFYDQISLPACDSDSSDATLIFTRRIDSKLDYSFKEFGVYTAVKVSESDSLKTLTLGEFVSEWETRNRVLFDNDVLIRVAKPKIDPILDWDFDDLRWSAFNSFLCDIPDKILYEEDPIKKEGLERIAIWRDHASHLLRKDISDPVIFITQEKAHNREIMKSLLAHSAFSILLPQLSDLHPDQILEVREKVAGNREGFSMDLQALSAEVESRINQGDSLADVAQYAKSVAETKFVPLYMEFRRQLSAERAGFWASVLDKASKIAEIDVAPWTPKFYGELLKSLGFTGLTAIKEGKDKLSNKRQAFNFIRKIDEKTKH